MSTMASSRLTPIDITNNVANNDHKKALIIKHVPGEHNEAAYKMK